MNEKNHFQIHGKLLIEFYQIKSQLNWLNQHGYHMILLLIFVTFQFIIQLHHSHINQYEDYDHYSLCYCLNQGFTPTNRSQVSLLHIPPMNGKNKLSAGMNSIGCFLIFSFSVDSSSYVFEQIDFRNLADSLMYENQVCCWLEKQRESSYLVCFFHLRNIS